MKKIIVFLTALILCGFSVMGRTNSPAIDSLLTLAIDTNPAKVKTESTTTTSAEVETGSDHSTPLNEQSKAEGSNAKPKNKDTGKQTKQEKGNKGDKKEEESRQQEGGYSQDPADETTSTNAQQVSQPKQEANSSDQDTTNYQKLYEEEVNEHSKTKEESDRYHKTNIILGIIAGLLLIILIIVLVLKKKADAQTLGSQTELQGMIDDLEDKVQSLTKEKAELESQKSNWEREKRSLEQELTGLRTKKAPVAPTAPSPKPAPPQPKILYAYAIVNGKFHRVKEQPDSAETNFELRLDSPTATSAKIYIYPGAERRILANPAFLEGCDKQILGNSRVETTHPGLAQKEGENNWVVTKKPEVIIR